MTEIDPTTIGAFVGCATAVCGALVYVGRKVEGVDRRLERLEAELAEARGAKLAERVRVLEGQVADLRAEAR
jgi:NADP-dependent 3-hydroxy acid dehydrogenase YdfG